MTSISLHHRRKSGFPALFATLAAVILLSACHSSKGTGGGNGYEPSQGHALTRSELNDLFTSLESSYSDWEGVKMPINLSLNSPKSFSIGGTLTMDRERFIHMSFRFFGMEVATLMVTADSIFAAYKVDRIYFAESISDLLGGFPATVGNVQNLILGRPFVLGEEGCPASRCRLDGNGATWTISPDRSPAGMSYDFTIDTPTGNVELLTVNVPRLQPIVADYSDFAVTATGPMAGVTAISTKSGNTLVSADITLNPRKAEWGKTSGKTWSVPRGYTRVRAAEILEKLNKKL